MRRGGARAMARGEELGGGARGGAGRRRWGRSLVATQGEEQGWHTSTSLFHGESAGTRDRDGER
jgi:hypothetical protein